MPNALTTDPSASQVVISGSIAYDHIMGFGGSFADHIIPEKKHVISISFLVDSLRKQRGGVGGNIAYNLALLGSSSTLVGAVGTDFGPYRAVFEDLGIDMTAVLEDELRLTASAFMMADTKNNQIASFFPGPADLSAEIDVTELGNRAKYGIVGATDPKAMIRHAEQLGQSSCRMIYDPAFQIIILSAEELTAGIDQSWAVIGNDYEFAMLERKTGLTVDAIADRVELTVVTYGEQGSELRLNGRTVRTPAAPAETVLGPTGAGDAYRAGLIKGLLLDLDLEVIGRLAGLTATYVVEEVGTQEHSYTPDEFVARFNRSFPDYAGALNVADLTAARPAHVLA
jgi:adenosine kinase